MVDQDAIHRKVVSSEVEKRREAVEQLRHNFADLPDNVGAWDDLYQLTSDEDSFVRLRAADAIGIAFQHVPEKDVAWGGLIWLTADEDNGVRAAAAGALGSVFQHVSDKTQAWTDLHLLTADEGSSVRWCAAYALGSAFQHVPEKDVAWDDLHRLTADEDNGVRRRAAGTLGSVFQQVPDKNEAWNDLHRLTADEDESVRFSAAYALGIAFQHVPEKDVAWDDLHRLAADEDYIARWGVADTLGIAFQHVPDKKQAWDDLHRLAADDESGVRVSANHSLGRASIFKATEAESEDGFESELNNAIKFFERSSDEAHSSNNPSSFCLPFYRSFCKITFEKAGAEGEVKRYLAEARSASEGSENKEILLEAVENLANALAEAHKAREMGLGAMKSEFNAYRQYCDRAADLIGDAVEGAPGAARVLRRGMPIIGERIREIQEKAEALCRETRGTGTPYEPLGRDINKWTRELSDRGYLRDEKDVPRIRDLLGQLCSLLHEDDQDYPCKIVEGIREGRKPEDTLSDIATALSYLVPSIRLQPPIDKTRSDGQPSQKTGHSTTVFAGAYSTVVVPHTETESGAVTVNTAVNEESQPNTQPDRSSKRTAIEISADIAVHVLVYTVLHHFAEELMPVIAPILVLSSLIILLLIIRNAKSG